VSSASPGAPDERGPAPARPVSDAVFADPRLARIYDDLDAADRPDLEAYMAMAEEFGARVVVDVGCGTGVLACRLAARGRTVVGIDPALASLEVARRRTLAERVRWLQGGAADLPPLAADLALMTGNVAQVFLTDTAWDHALGACRRALRPGGRLVFEVRDPGRQAWRSWTREASYRVLDLPQAGRVETWLELVDVAPPYVTFRHEFVFRADGTRATSQSTLRFRDRSEILASLSGAGLALESVRDAPDRPGLEFVFVARRPERG